MPGYEKPRKGNPNRLTIKQHVLPAASIARFANSNGGVWVHDLVREKRRITRCGDPIFCARRAWDQRSESGYMRRIEDAFQTIADMIIAGMLQKITPYDRMTINRFYALWRHRARYRIAPDDVKVAGILGEHLTKEQEENLEANGYSYVRANGSMPGRQMNGLQLEMRISLIGRSNVGDAEWGIVRADDGEFIVPDVPVHTILPLTPSLCLMAPGSNATIARYNVGVVNRMLRNTSQAYYFARDFAACPFH